MTLQYRRLKALTMSLLFVIAMVPLGGCRASCSGDSDVEDAVEDVADEVEDAVD